MSFDITFLNIKNNLNSISDEMLKHTDESMFIERIQAAKMRLENQKMNVLVVGEFSRGKSTFINAILGKPVLPSKVNPTTATINILEGSSRNKMTIYYWDKKKDELFLPEDKVNKFLDEFVTTVNKGSNNIEKVTIEIPGKLESWNCLLVDTPGVNDLDEAREELTYKYLSQADACIVLLDSQQPLSDSERRFIKDKVLKKDINRMIFVVNRMDEIESEPNGNASTRIKVYVEKIIKENIPQLENPKIFSVSSKETLRARYKKEDSSWEKAFEAFEDDCVKFISANASKGKLPEHVIRLQNITMDILAHLVQQKNVINLSGQELEELFDRLSTEEKTIELQLQTLNSIIENEKLELERKLRTNANELFSALKSELISNAEKINSDETFANLKSQISQGIRYVTEQIIEMISDYRGNVYSKIANHFNNNFNDNNALGYNTNKASKIKVNTEYELFIVQREAEENTRQIEDIAVGVAIGGIAGYVGAALFGPVGIIAGIIGAEIANGKVGSMIEEKRWEARRSQIVSDITNQINSIIINSERNSSQMAESEMNEIAAIFSSIAENKIASIKNTLQDKRHNLINKGEDIESKKAKLNKDIETFNNLLSRLLEVKGELTNG